MDARLNRSWNFRRRGQLETKHETGCAGGVTREERPIDFDVREGDRAVRIGRRAPRQNENGFQFSERRLLCVEVERAFERTLLAVALLSAAACTFSGKIVCDEPGHCPVDGANPQTATGGGTQFGSGGKDSTPPIAVGGGSGGTAGTPPASVECNSPAVGVSALRRLDRVRYEHAVRDLFGVDYVAGADFPSDEKLASFASNSVTPLDRLAVEQYFDAASDVADLAVARLSDLMSCDRQTAGDAACADELIDTFGERAYRRPLTAAERKRYQDLTATGVNTFEDGIRLVFTALLSSPQFLYQEELTDGEAQGPRLLNGYELSTRLAWTLWGSVPDAELMQVATDGKLDGEKELRAQAERMLADERAADSLESFYLQWLGLDAIDDLEKSPGVYPDFDAATALAMRHETARFVDYVVRHENGTLDTLFNAPIAFPEGPLAAIYGVKTSADPEEPVSLDPDERAGILTRAAFLAVQAHPNQTSPVRRGVVVLRNIMCVDLPNPPANVNNATPELDADATTRERFAAHTTSGACAGCHSLIDPIGFAFEHYDAVGSYRTTENGVHIDASGELTQADGKSVAFDDAIALSKALSESPDVRQCLVRQWFRYALGRYETDADKCSLARVDDAFAASGYRLRELMLALVTSDSFRYVNGGSR